jgi:gliding motility-associated-like protein
MIVSIRFLLMKKSAFYFLVLIAFTFSQKVSGQKPAAISCDEDITVPTYFSPNIDGIPETFRAHFNSALPVDYSMDIYDTSGLLVFTTSDPLEGWNGSYYNHGAGLADGKYAWTISYQWQNETEMHTCKGNVKCVGIRNIPVNPKDSLSCATIFIPNAMTPNCEAFDCDFHPYFYCPPVSYEMWIFDRWGNMLFHSSDYQKGWNAKMEGKDELVQEDTYVVKIRCSFFPGDKKHDYTTHLNVIR